MGKWMVFSALFFLSACGWVDQRFGRLQKGQTRATFRIGNGSRFSTQALELYGRVGIYLVGVNGNPYSTNLFVDNRFQQASIVVPNGSYRVYAVGWDGDYSGPCSDPNLCHPVESQAHCSDPSAPLVNLAGGSAAVDISLSQGNCAFTGSSVFSVGDTGLTNLKPLTLKLCGSGSSLPTCNTPGSSWDVSMEVVTYIKNGGSFQILESLTNQIGCAANVSNSGSGTSKDFLPGNSASADHPFAYRFRIYPGGSGCTGTVQAEFLFGEGLSSFATAPGSSVSYFDYVNASAAYSQLMLAGPF